MFKLKIKFLIIFIFMSSVIELHSQESTTYDFLRVSPSARSSSLAGTFHSFTDDPNVIFFNPAGLSTLSKNKASASFGKYLLDINFGSASYSQKYKDIGWFGLGINYFNYGTFDYADASGVTSGTFSANDIVISLGYSNYIYDVVNYGVNIKYIYSSIAEYNSSALGFDFGLLYVIPEKMLNFSLTVNNIGTQLDPYINTREKLPLDVTIGFSKKLEHLPLNLNVEFHNLNQDQDKLIKRFKYFSIGGEFTFSENVQARIGYNNENRQDLKLSTSLGIAGFSAGLGIHFLERYTFDYSLNSLGKIGSTHRFSLGYSFN